MIVYDAMTSNNPMARFLILPLISSIALESSAHLSTACIPSRIIATMIMVPTKLVAANVMSCTRSTGLGFGSDSLMPSVLLILQEHVLLTSCSAEQLMPNVHSLFTRHCVPSSVFPFGHSHQEEKSDPVHFGRVTGVLDVVVVDPVAYTFSPKKNSLIIMCKILK